MTDFNFQQAGLRTLHTERDAISQLAQYINDDFTQACQLILKTKGKVVVMGMGKSGHIGKKIAATFASTGTPAFFVHPGEASHGDLGMISEHDTVLAISNSGESQEILALLPVIKRRGITFISMTANLQSNMSRYATVALCIKVDKEACPIGLAPTSSTTATLVMGDALAVALMEARGFTCDDFALSHPGGALGRKLLLHLSDVMRTKEAIPTVTSDCNVRDALFEISAKGLGMTAVVNNENQVIGIFTDGDLRRLLDQKRDIHKTQINDVMKRQPYTLPPDLLAAEGLKIMEKNKINSLLIVENNQLVGALNMHDLLSAGVI